MDNGKQVPVVLGTLHLIPLTWAKHVVVGFLGYPQPGGGAHPPIPCEGGLEEVPRAIG